MTTSGWADPGQPGILLVLDIGATKTIVAAVDGSPSEGG